MNIKLILAFAASIGLSACSTIANGQNQLIEFSTGEVEGADCLAKGGSDFAVSESFVSPASVQIPRSKKILRITCDKSGYETGTALISGEVEGTTAGNVILGGIVGLGVDALTGAIYKYPDTVLIKMVKTGVNTPTVTGEPIT